MIGTEPEFFKTKYFVMERFNFHITPDAPQDIVEAMKIYRKEHYNDDFIYGDPAIHSETKDGIHIDK